MVVGRSCGGNKVCDKKNTVEEEGALGRRFSQIVFGGWGNQASEKKGSNRRVRKRTF